MRRSALASVGVSAAALVSAALAWACVPEPTSFTLDRSAGEAGDTVLADGRGFQPQQVQIRMDEDPTVIGTAQGPDFDDAPVLIPANACRGSHVIIASVGNPHGHGVARHAFNVTGPSSAPACPPPATQPPPPPPPTGNNPPPPTGNNNPPPVSRRARAIAACKRKYRGRSRAAKRKRAACIRRAKRRYRA